MSKTRTRKDDLDEVDDQDDPALSGSVKKVWQYEAKKPFRCPQCGAFGVLMQGYYLCVQRHRTETTMPEKVRDRVRGDYQPYPD